MNNPVSQRNARGVELARIVGCCLLLVVERSTAFVMSGAGPCQATVSGVRGAFASSFLSVSSMLPLPSRPSSASWSSRRASLPGRTRRTRFAMEVAVNPVSNRQYGKEDGKDGAGEHLINDDITAYPMTHDAPPELSGFTAVITTDARTRVEGRLAAERKKGSVSIPDLDRIGLGDGWCTPFESRSME